MHEPQRLGVERLPGTHGEAVVHELLVLGEVRAFQYLVAAIPLVVEQRVADMLHVYANLVRAPRLQHAFHKGDIADAFQHVIMGDGVFPYLGVGEDGHLQAVFRIARDVALYRPVVLVDDAPYQRIVLSLGGLMEELESQVRLGVGCLSTNGFRIAGGVIIFKIGYDMLQARYTSMKLTDSEIKEYVNDISITPLGIPMLCGPGAIANAIVMMQDAESMTMKGILIGTIAFVYLLTYFILRASTRLVSVIGETGNNVMMRLMGLILMVIAVECFVGGIRPILLSVLTEAASRVSLRRQ